MAAFHVKNSLEKKINLLGFAGHLFFTYFLPFYGHFFTSFFLKTNTSITIFQEFFFLEIPFISNNLTLQVDNY